jgi:hypothetical protein
MILCLILTIMSTTESTQHICKCGKTYKTKSPYIKHVQKCQFKQHDTNAEEQIDNIQINATDEEDTEQEQPRLGRHLAPDAEYLAQVDNDMKNDLQDFMTSGGKLPRKEQLEGENVTVNTLVIETLLKTVLTQVLSHHHRHTQNVIDQNTKLIEENKMLVRMLRTIVYAKNNIKYEVDVQSDDENDGNQDEEDSNTMEEKA